MKHGSKFLSILLFGALFAFASTGYGASNEPEFTISFADFFPATHAADKQIVQGWADAVEKATHGRVEVQVYPGGTLLGATEIYQGVVNGVADVGHSAIGYSMGRFPVMGATYLGGIRHTSSEASSYLARDLWKKFNPKGMQDTHFLFVYGLGPGDIISTVPVKTLDDLQGLKVRSSGRQAKTFELLGASAVGMSMPEVYQALQKGTIDAVAAPAEILKGWKMYEVADQITKVNFVYNATHYVTMNKATWNSFPKDIQKTITKVSQHIFEDVAAPLFDKIVAQGYAYAKKNGNPHIYQLSKAQQKIWMQQLKPIKDSYIQAMTAKGLPGKDIYNTVVKLSKKYNKEYPRPY